MGGAHLALAQRLEHALAKSVNVPPHSELEPSRFAYQASKQRNRTRNAQQHPAHDVALQLLQGVLACGDGRGAAAQTNATNRVYRPRPARVHLSPFLSLPCDRPPDVFVLYYRLTLQRVRPVKRAKHAARHFGAEMPKL